VVHGLGEDPLSPGCYFGTVQDVTAQRAAEIALRDAEERFHRAFEEAPIGMALISPDGRVEHANAALGVICGRIRHELEGSSFRELLHPADADGINEAFMALAGGEIDQLAAELRIVPSAGAPVDIYRSTEPSCAMEPMAPIGSCASSRTSPTASATNHSSSSWPTTNRSPGC
jgi:PAS domain S-box-containing protein